MDQRPEGDWHRLVRYLTGEDGLEEKETQFWILEDGERARLMDELKRIWDATETSISSRDVDAAWEEVRHQLELEASGTSNGSEAGDGKGSSGKASTGSSSTVPGETEGAAWSRLRDGQQNGRHSFTRAMTFGGALVATALLVALVFFGLPSRFADEASSRTFTTEPGEQATVRLSDGSKVRLNVDSRLKVPADFGEEERAVRLEGEGYFEVAPDKDRPFSVMVDGVRTEVLGTAFSVKAYAEEKDPQVAVDEGTVALHPDRSTAQDTVRLKAQHLGTVSEGHVQVVQGNAVIQKQTAWMNGKLVFDDTPFGEVVLRIKRWYDIPIETRVSPSKVDRLNATFREESSRKVVEAIAAALDLQYRKKGKTVIFYRRD